MFHSIGLLKLWLFCSLLLMGCQFYSEQEAIVEPCPEIQATSANLPKFLHTISPAPDSVITLHCYNEHIKDNTIEKGIFTKIIISEIVEEGDKLEIEDIADKVNILINSELMEDASKEWIVETSLVQHLDEEGNVITSYPGSKATISSPVGLDPGSHSATVQVRKTSGMILEYSWTFTIEP